MKRVLVGIAAAALVAAGITSAHAVATLTLSDGVNPVVTVADGGLGDFNAAAGVVTFIGGVGNFTVNVTTGLTYPALGATNRPHMDISSVNVGGAGTLSIMFSEIDYVQPPLGPGVLAAGGTTGQAVSFAAYYGASNTLFDTGALIASLGPFAPGAFAGTGSGAIGAASPYSLTMTAVIDHSGGFATTSFDSELKVIPEPASMLLLGTGLLGLAGIRRRKP